MRTLRLLGLSFSLLFLASWSNATTLIQRPFEVRLQRAGEIFSGQVVGLRSESSEDFKTIYTFVDFAVSEVLKGEAQPGVKTLRFEGGTINGRVLQVVGMPEFNIGEQVILLVKQKINIYTDCPLEGWIYGKFIVQTDEATGEKIVSDFRGQKITGVNFTTGDLQVVKEVAVSGPAGNVISQQVSTALGGSDLLRKQEEENQAAPLSAKQFKKLIRALLQMNRTGGATAEAIFADKKPCAVAPPEVRK